MRILIKTSPSVGLIPFDYQKSLVGSFHKWLGENRLHDEISLYSLSWLQGATATKDGLEFRRGGEWSISAHDPRLLKSLIKGIQSDPAISYGMEVDSITIMDAPEFRELEKFHLNSPVFVKRKESGRKRYYLHNDKETDLLMTQTMMAKLKKAGLNHEGIKIAFDKTYHNPKTKKISFGGIDCRASFCPVIIEGSPEQIEFAWNVGVGNSTGIGFGSLR